jgi:peptidyl-prolyl cis-trans isomerase B (cyclophilin B)
LGYAVSGKVIGGTDVVDGIAKVKTGTVGPFTNIPPQTILVKRVVRQSSRSHTSKAPGRIL